MELTGLVIWAILIGLALALLIAIASGQLSGKGGGAAAITAFHDMQPRDKQNAVEIIVEQKAGKRLEELESGEGSDGERTTEVNEKE